MVDSRRDVAGQAGRSPSPSVQATMIGLMAILLWSLMTGLVRVVADAFGATLGSALIYTCGAVLLLVFRRPAPLRKYPRTYLIVGGLLFVFYESSISLSIGLASSAASSVEVSLVNYLWPTMMVLLAAAFVPSGEKRSARNEGIGRNPQRPATRRLKMARSSAAQTAAPASRPAILVAARCSAYCLVLSSPPPA